MASAPAQLEYLGPITGRSEWEFDQAIADEICDMLEEGLSLTIICKQQGMPGRTTVYKWRKENEGFANDYARARATQSDTFADQIQDIADNPFIPAAMKAQMIDARKWRAARQNWRAWGDKVQHEHALQPAEPLAPGRLPGSLAFLDRRSGGDGDDSAPVDS